jgi:hypothetical protein
VNGTPQAFVFQNGQPLPNGDSQTSFLLCVFFIVGDGSAPPEQLGIQYVYDATQNPATNLANLKAAVVAAAQSDFPTITTSDVLVFLAVN